MTKLRIRLPELAILLGFSTHAAVAQAVRDSAGVRIIDNAAPLWMPGREWKLSANPVLDIGGGGRPNHDLGRVVGALRLSDGRIVVGDESASRLMFYDSTGRHLAAIGGEGAGPGALGEFHAIVRLPGDTIVVEATRTSTIVAPSGTVVRTMRFGPFAPGSIQTPFVGVLGRFDNGTAVVTDYPQGTNPPAGARQWIDSGSLFLAGPDGAVLRPLGKAPIVVFVAGTNHPTPLDLGPSAPHASSGRSLYIGFTDQYAIRVYDSDWKLERIIRRAWTPRPLAPREIDDYVDGWLRMWSKKTGAELEAERREMRAGAYPQLLPAYSALLVTRAGEVWAREPDMTGAPGCWCLAGMPTVPSRWSVFDATGRWLGDVAMPARFIPFDIGADYVLGRSRGADDKPHVLMYRLEKPR